MSIFGSLRETARHPAISHMATVGEQDVPLGVTLDAAGRLVERERPSGRCGG